MQNILQHVLGKLSFEFATELLNYGANINAQDRKGRTALYLAIRRENKEVFEVLLKRGADVHLKKNNGISSLRYAIDTAPNWFLKMMIKFSNIENSYTWGICTIPLDLIYLPV